MRQEREVRLQTYRRARSLSPSKHPRSFPQEAVPSPKVSAAMPSRRKDYLQQLRQEVIDSTRYDTGFLLQFHYNVLKYVSNMFIIFL